MQNLDAVRTKWLEAAAAAASPAALEDVRVKALGKSGEISSLMKGLGAMTPDQRNRLIDLLATASETETMLLAEVDSAVVAETRARFPFMQDRRQDRWQDRWPPPG